MDTRKPWFDLLMVSMLLTQLFFMGFMMMRLIGVGVAEEKEPAQADSSKADIVAANTLENRSLKMALSALASSTDREQVAEQMVNLETNRQELAASLQGQLARVELLSLEKADLETEYANQGEQVKALADEVTSLRKKISTSLPSSTDADDTLEDGESKPSTFSLSSLIGTGLVGLLLGGGATLLFRRPKDDEIDQAEMNFESTSSKTGN